MEKFLKKFLLIIYPFYPLWGWMTLTFGNIPVDKVVNVILLPFALLFLFQKKSNFPMYLRFLGLFTIYHLCSTLYFDLVPKDTTTFLYILSDYNVFAFVVLMVVENVKYDGKFIRTLSYNIYYIVIISLVVTLIQIGDSHFFLASNVKEDSLYIEQQRSFSIYSWVSLNSVGITFPILISILVSSFIRIRKKLLITVICGIIVAFLTKARYIMISAIIVLFQMIFSGLVAMKKRVSYVMIFLGTIVILFFSRRSIWCGHAIDYK
jgi:hypothetical protein